MSKSGLGYFLLNSGIGGYSFRDALFDFAPYSPRLAYNFLDPLNSLFQGNTLTPVTVVTNPVGVVIDQTQGGLGNLGAELVTNGSFTTDTDWTKGTGWTISGGVASRSNIGSSSSITQAEGLVATRSYLLTYTLTQTSGNFNTAFQGGTSVFGPNRTTSGTYTELLTAVTGNNVLAFQAGSTFAGTIDNVSLRLIPGNHATASSDAKRPLFARRPATGRRNLLTYSEEFGNAAWTKAQTTVVQDSITNPINGETTADLILEAATTNVHRVQQSATLAAGSTATTSVYVKAAGRDYCLLYDANASVGRFFSIPADGTGAALGTFVGAPTSSTITHVGSGWYRISITFTVSVNPLLYLYTSTTGSDSNFAGDATKGIYVFGAQTEQSATATNYQKVVTSADITEAGVRDVYQALFDGSDDCLQVSGFDLSDTDTVCVIAGVRKLSDAAFAIIAEHSADSNSNNGTFALQYPRSGAVSAPNFVSRGTSLASTTSTGTYAAPRTSHLVGCGDISSDIAKIAENNVTLFTVSTDQGTGNLSNNTLYIGQRGGSTAPFNGAISYLFILGAVPPDDVLTRIYRGLAPQIGVSV